MHISRATATRLLTIIHSHFPQNINPGKETERNDNKGQDRKPNGDAIEYRALCFCHGRYHYGCRI